MKKTKQKTKQNKKTKTKQNNSYLFFKIYIID